MPNDAVAAHPAKNGTLAALKPAATLSSLAVPFAAAFAAGEILAKLIPDAADTPFLRAAVWKAMLSPLLVAVFLIGCLVTGRTSPFDRKSETFAAPSRVAVGLLGVMMLLWDGILVAKASREKFLDVPGVVEIARTEVLRCGDGLPACQNTGLLGFGVTVYPAPATKGFIEVCPSLAGTSVQLLTCQASGPQSEAANNKLCREVPLPVDSRRIGLVACVSLANEDAASIRQGHAFDVALRVENRDEGTGPHRNFKSVELSSWRKWLLR